MTAVINKFSFIFGGLPEHDKHVMEKIGDVGLYPVTRLPKITLNFISNPKVLVVAAGLTSASTWTYFNYPDKLIPILTELVKLLPQLPIDSILQIGRAGLWGTGIELIAALTARTYGRVANKDCVDTYWGMIPPATTNGKTDQSATAEEAGTSSKRGMIPPATTDVKTDQSATAEKAGTSRKKK